MGSILGGLGHLQDHEARCLLGVLLAGSRDFTFLGFYMDYNK